MLAALLNTLGVSCCVNMNCWHVADFAARSPHSLFKKASALLKSQKKKKTKKYKKMPPSFFGSKISRLWTEVLCSTMLVHKFT